MNIEDLKEIGIDEENAEKYVSAINAYLKDYVHKDEVKSIKIEAEIEKCISKFNGKNVKAITALLDVSKIDEENLKDEIKSQVENLTKNEETSFLFDNEQKKAKPTGITPAAAKKESQNMDVEKFRALSPSERFDFSKSNPQQYKNLYE